MTRIKAPARRLSASRKAASGKPWAGDGWLAEGEAKSVRSAVSAAIKKRSMGERLSKIFNCGFFLRTPSASFVWFGNNGKFLRPEVDVAVLQRNAAFRPIVREFLCESPVALLQ
ncbi:hypothetical protein [Pulveribacter sp.]|uniref:hypothetical protein n=1 Tax=Pulveribacter sp. TaxID=2678893 RepID=UPI0028AF9F98|nr:hypothetical protein [Pulveribacter sp.]